MNRAVLAVAGSRKTQSIVDACIDSPGNRRRLVLTYTISAQRDVETRLARACSAQLPDVTGWYAFLLHHWIRPYLPLLFPDRRLTGLNFTERTGVDYTTGPARYLDGNSRAYKRYLAKLAVDVAAASNGAVIDRLEHMYDEIHVDEVQDLTGYDLEVLEKLFASRIDIHLVGDVRQSTFNTNPQDPKNKKYRDLKMLDWFVHHGKKNTLSVEYSNRTWRSNQIIATFSDTIFPESCDFPPTESLQTRTTTHDGVFVVPTKHVDTYIKAFSPLCLRHSSATRTPDGVQPLNFGVAKGFTCDRVLIFPTTSIADFLNKGKQLTGKSACGLYVATTRAIHSVAFVLDGYRGSTLATWAPT
ncbi:UvrD-helicase domain-containing protein [Pseudonocardia alni]|uniref:UvrD-helicase domain-containing protein n=1 Tax=Pseudonocardia alni TaxID=33907 RepID=UPI00332F1966